MDNHIFRIEKNKNFTVMSNLHLNDEKLSWKAKGLHSYILSKPDDWKVIVEQLIKASTDGKTSTRNAIKELHNNFYWQKYPVYVNGKIDHWETIIYETPYKKELKIKNIKIIKGKKIISYEIAQPQKTSLLAEKRKVAEPQETSLLTENPKVGSIEVDRGTLLNTEVNNTNITKSVSPSCTNNKIKEEKKEIKEDRQTDKKENIEHLELENKVNELDLNNTYTDRETVQAINDALDYIYFDDSKIKNHSMVIRQKNLKRINSKIIDKALFKFNDRTKNTNIKQPLKYLATCIYSQIFEVSTESLNINNKINNMKL